jgi:hypothetical protein
VEEEVSVVVEQFRVQLVDEIRSRLDVAGLDRVPDLDPVVHRLEVDLGREAAFFLKLFGGFLEALWNERILLLSLAR